MKTITVATEYKSLGDAGDFEGYASVFNNVDLGGDVVEKGAFKEMSLTKDGMIRVLNNHNTRDPLGKAFVVEDDHGLQFKGRLLLELPSARSVYALMKSGITDGMSIGYDILSGGAEITKAGVRKLTALKLWEISAVTFGMNQLARIDSVKAAGDITTIREFEAFLRDEGGFSAGQAKALASSGYGALQAEREVSPDAAVERLLATLQANRPPKSLLT